MKYEENVWHGWNGGECPVHPETVVQVVLYDVTNTVRPMDEYKHSEMHVPAKKLKGCWEHRVGLRHIIAFRVIKEHKEPREFWLHMGSVWRSREDIDYYVKEYNLGAFEIIHVKEVLE